MRTVTMMLHRRPELLVGALNALFANSAIPKFDRIVLSIDGGEHSRELEEHCEALVGALEDVGCRNVDTMTMSENLGPTEHAREILTRMFEGYRTDLNVFLEDDAFLTPDALALALWFEKFQPMLQPDAILLSMCNHRDFGRGQHPEIPDDPSILAESPYITSPFAWATTRRHWPFLRRWWGFKRLPPNAPSFSVSMAMRMAKKLCLHPVLSRCQNFGRNAGVNETPESFDATQEGLKYAGEYSGNYEIRARLDAACLDVLDDWMVPEFDRLQALVRNPTQ